jgi:hypothetical protein
MHPRSSWAAAVLLAVTAAPSAAQDRWEQQVRRQLIESAMAAGHEGLDLSHAPHTGKLKRADYEDTTLELRAGRAYVILAVCDDDCLDMDLGLYDDSGMLVSQDLKADDHPVVAVRPPRTAVYTVRAAMIHCADPPCRYGVGVFQRK